MKQVVHARSTTTPLSTTTSTHHWIVKITSIWVKIIRLIMMISSECCPKINSLRQLSLRKETCHRSGRTKSTSRTLNGVALAHEVPTKCQTNCFLTRNRCTKIVEVSWIRVIYWRVIGKALSAVLTQWNHLAVFNAVTRQMCSYPLVVSRWRGLRPLMMTCGVILTCHYRRWTVQYKSQQ